MAQLRETELCSRLWNVYFVVVGANNSVNGAISVEAVSVITAQVSSIWLSRYLRQWQCLC